MRKIVAIFVVLALVATAFAQPGAGGPRGGRGMAPGMGMGFGAGFGLLMMPEVQRELGLTQQQIQQLQQLWQQQRAQMQELWRQRGSNDPSRPPEGWQQLWQQQQEQIGRILQPAQRTRLRQLELQRMGPAALMRPDVTSELNLTEQQQQKIRDIMQQYGQKTAQLMQEARNAQVDPQVWRQRLQQLREQTDKELLGVLTPEQQEQWKKMLGKPFEFPRGPWGPGGMRRGAPPAGNAPREL